MIVQLAMRMCTVQQAKICQAPLCPADVSSHLGAMWYRGEPICKADLAPAWVEKQKAIKSDKKMTDGPWCVRRGRLVLAQKPEAGSAVRTKKGSRSKRKS